MTHKITVRTLYGSGSQDHESEHLMMHTDERGNLTIQSRVGSGTAQDKYEYATLAIYASGCWSDATHEKLAD